MSAVIRELSSVATVRISLPAVILIGGCLNGFAARIIEALTVHGFTSLTFGLSPFELIALLAAARLVLKAEGEQSAMPGAAEFAVIALLLVPSSAVSWAALALYAFWHASRSSGDAWRGSILFLGLALCALWSSVALKWLALPVTTAEAFVLGQIVGFLRPDILQVGNVVGNPAVHTLVLMTACTSADGAPPAILALLAVANFLGGVDRNRTVPACAIMVALYVVVNLVRLAAMAWSPEGYVLFHGPIGSNLFDGLMTGAVLLLGNWTSRS